MPSVSPVVRDDMYRLLGSDLTLLMLDTYTEPQLTASRTSVTRDSGVVGVKSASATSVRRCARNRKDPAVAL
jgi:hypothetical protein